MRTFRRQTKAGNEPAKTAFEAEGTSRMDFSEVSILSPQSGPRHLNRFPGKGQISRHRLQGSSVLRETVSLASSYFSPQLLFEAFELQQKTN